MGCSVGDLTVGKCGHNSSTTRTTLDMVETYGTLVARSNQRSPPPFRCLPLTQARHHMRHAPPHRLVAARTHLVVIGTPPTHARVPPAPCESPLHVPYFLDSSGMQGARSAVPLDTAHASVMAFRRGRRCFLLVIDEQVPPAALHSLWAPPECTPCACRCLYTTGRGRRRGHRTVACPACLC